VSYFRPVLTIAALASLSLALAGAASAQEPTSGSSGGACQDARLVPNKDNPARIRAAMLCLLNVERTSRGLTPLRSSGQLRKVATDWSRTMVRKHFFDHVSPAGSTMLSRVRKSTSYLNRNVRDWALGENLGWGSGPRSTPQVMVRMWMASDGHRDNILNDRFRHIGIGVATGAPANIGGQRAATYTTDFGYRVMN
jgi:uncharacterized protein YkwD